MESDRMGCFALSFIVCALFIPFRRNYRIQVDSVSFTLCVGFFCEVMFQCFHSERYEWLFHSWAHRVYRINVLLFVQWLRQNMNVFLIYFLTQGQQKQQEKRTRWRNQSQSTVYGTVVTNVFCHVSAHFCLFLFIEMRVFLYAFIYLLVHNLIVFFCFRCCCCYPFICVAPRTAT